MQRITHLLLKVLFQVYGLLIFCLCKQAGQGDSRNELIGGHLKDPYKMNLNRNENVMPQLWVISLYWLYKLFLCTMVINAILPSFFSIIKGICKNIICSTRQVTFLNWYLAKLNEFISFYFYISIFFLVVRI